MLCYPTCTSEHVIGFFQLPLVTCVRLVFWKGQRETGGARVHSRTSGLSSTEGLHWKNRCSHKLDTEHLVSSCSQAVHRECSWLFASSYYGRGCACMYTPLLVADCFKQTCFVITKYCSKSFIHVSMFGTGWWPGRWLIWWSLRLLDCIFSESEQIEKLFQEQCGSPGGRLNLEQFTAIMLKLGYNSEHCLQCFK